MGQGSFALGTSHDPIAFLTLLLDRLPAGVAALCTAERTGVWSQYFAVVVVQDWQREGQHRPTLVGLLRRSWSKPNGTRTPPPVLVVSFELQGASITAPERRRELLDLVCPSFALADGCPSQGAVRVRAAFRCAIRSGALCRLTAERQPVVPCRRSRRDGILIAGLCPRCKGKSEWYRGPQSRSWFPNCSVSLA